MLGKGPRPRPRACTAAAARSATSVGHPGAPAIRRSRSRRWPEAGTAARWKPSENRGRFARPRSARWMLAVPTRAQRAAGGPGPAARQRALIRSPAARATRCYCCSTPGHRLPTGSEAPRAWPSQATCCSRDGRRRHQGRARSLLHSATPPTRPTSTALGAAIGEAAPAPAAPPTT